MQNPKQDVEQVYQSLQRQARYLQIVNELALALLRTSTMDEVLWLVAKSAIAELGFEDCVIYLLDESEKNLVQRAAHGPKNPVEHEILDPITIPLGQGIVGTVASTGIGEVIQDTRLDSRYILDDQMRLSEIAMPIVHDGKVIGVIDSENPAAHYYTEEHKDVLTTIASIASTRISTALTLERLRETVATLAATEAELRGSEERYRTLYNANPSMFFTLSEQGVILGVNAFAATQLGYTVKQLIGRSLSSLYYADSKADDITEKLAQCLRKPGTPVRWESCLQTKTDTPLWVRETARAIELKDGGREILVVSEDISDVQKLSQELQYHATHDALTGLRNRREFEAHLQDALAQTRAEAAEHVLLFLDLDRFKTVNDSCGHVAGDELLRQISQLFLAEIRRADVVARVGGDEFAILMQYCDLPDALKVAEAIRTAVEAYRFHWGDRLFSIGVSIGVIRIDADDENIKSVLAKVDSACYQAKQLGRNRVHLYSDDDQPLAAHSRDNEWLERLQHAFEHDRFVLLQQPIVAARQPLAKVPTATHHPYCEVLLRMLDANNSLIPPTAFLPAAERYGMSLRLDRYVISRVLDCISQNQHPPTAAARLYGINISGFSLGDELLQHIRAELSRTGTPATVLCFEITETAVIAHFSKAQPFIKALQAIGCQFALDDFGSGLSSFTYLKHLPVDYLKIDGTHIRGLLDDSIDLALVKAMNDIAHQMGILTIAEQVDSAVLVNKLVELGIDYVQGHQLAEPYPLQQQADRVATRLAQKTA